MKCNKCGNEIPKDIKECLECKAQEIKEHTFNVRIDSPSNDCHIDYTKFYTNKSSKTANEVEMFTPAKLSAMCVFGLTISFSLLFSHYLESIIFLLILCVILPLKGKRSGTLLIAINKFILFAILWIIIAIGVEIVINML